MLAKLPAKASPQGCSCAMTQLSPTPKKMRSVEHRERHTFVEPVAELCVKTWSREASSAYDQLALRNSSPLKYDNRECDKLEGTLLVRDEIEFVLVIFDCISLAHWQHPARFPPRIRNQQPRLQAMDFSW